MSDAQATTFMTTAAEVIDVEALLVPISEDNAAGENLQYSGLHDEIREARRADENLEQGDWKRDLKIADWNSVFTLSIEALTDKTKDLQIAAWLSEALVKLHGLAGLRDSLKLMRGLHEQFWESVYPEIDEEDLDARANALAWMDKQVATAIKGVQLTNSPTGTNFSFIDYEEAKQFDIPEDLSTLETQQLDRIEALKAQVTEEGKLTTEDWAKARRATRRAFFEETFALLNECWDEYQFLDGVMDEKFGRQTPGLGDIKKAIDVVRTLIENIVKEKRLSEPYASEGGDATATDGETQSDAGEAGQGFATSGGSIRARQDAFRRLTEVADYFRIHEPHNPVSYLVQRAIKWGQMPLELWLEDVIKDGGVLGNLRETLGLKSAFSESSDE
jgi:type VI secretion system protein ImpA